MHSMAVAVANVIRFALALTLVFSGAVKLNDPIGTKLKFQEYLDAWSLNIPQEITLLGAAALGMLEFSLGVYLFFGIGIRKTSRLILVFMSAMTLLTAYIVIFNPVEDCGCFGDAVVLTNVQTFAKNIVLLAMIAFVVWKPCWQVKLMTHRTSWLLSLFTLGYALWLPYYCVKNLPVVDYRPFHIGVSIPEGMEVPDDEQPIYESKIVYEKDGQRIILDAEDEDPDSTWQYVETQSKLIKEGGKPSITNFYIYDTANDVDVTDNILYDEGYTFLLVSADLATADDGASGQINDVYDYCMAHGYAFHGVTASDSTDISHWVDHTGAEYDVCFGEAQTLQSMVRANPGLILLHAGRVIKKWGNHNLPTMEELNKPLEEMELDKNSVQDIRKQTVKLILLFFGPLLLLVIIDRIAAQWTLYRRMREKAIKIADGLEDKEIKTKKD